MRRTITTASAIIILLLGSLLCCFHDGVFPALVLDAAGHRCLNVGAIFGADTAGRGLVVIPGHGLQPERSAIIRHNAEYIDRKLFDCVVFVYKDDRYWWEALSGDVVRADPTLGGCARVYEVGQWTHFIGLITPSMVRAAGYTSVTLLIDDVEIGQISEELQGRTVFPHGFDLVTTIEVMDKNGIDVSSPNIYGSDFRTMARGLTWHHGAAYVTVNPTRHGGREINFIEIQLTTFRNLDIYECYHGLLDPVRNAPGWGVDVCLQPLCGGRFAVLDTVAVHRGRRSFIGGIGTAVESGGAAWRAMNEWFSRIKATHPKAVNFTNIWDCKSLTGAIAVHRRDHMQPADVGEPAGPSRTTDGLRTLSHNKSERDKFFTDKLKWDFCWYLSGTNTTAPQDRTPCGCWPGDVCQSIELERAQSDTQREWIEWAYEQYDAPDGGIIG